MSFRTWLLMGTSATLLALAPLSAARAQDATNPALQTAYQAYQADQSDDNKQKLTEACIAAGFTGLDDCLAALTASAAPAQPAAQPAPAPSSEAAPAPQEQAAPAPSSEAAPPPPPPSSEAPPPPPAPSSEAAPPPPAPSSEAAPAPQPAPAQKAAPAATEDPTAKLTALVDDYNKNVDQLAAGKKGAQRALDRDKAQIDKLCQAAGFADADACLAQLGLTLNPLPASSAEQPAPSAAPAQTAPAASTEAAPAATESSAAPAPAPSSEAAPAPTSSESAAPAQNTAPAGVTVPPRLKNAVDAYNKAVAAIGTDANAQATADKARAQIDAICKKAGFTDIEACTAQFGLTLTPMPAAAPAPASAPEVTAPSSAAQEQTSSVPPISELPKAGEAVTPSAVEVLPSNVASEAAPILDSAKDQQTSASAPAQPAQASSAPAGAASSSVQPPPPPAQPPGPPPKTDQAAQADIQPPPKADQSAVTEKGKPKGSDFKFVKPEAPQGNPDVKVVQAPKNDNGGVVFQIGINLFISNPLQDRNRNYNPNEGDRVTYEDLSFGRTRETIARRDGVKVVTIYSRNGDILQRSKILSNGREIIIASGGSQGPGQGPGRGQGQGGQGQGGQGQSGQGQGGQGQGGQGQGGQGGGFNLDDDWHDPGRDLPPLVLNIPAKDYILDADSADENEVSFFLDQPPVEKVKQIYTIDDVKRSARLRDMVRRLEVGNLTFDTGKATISRDQVGSLANVAQAMLSLLDKNPGEVFLIEGHTDAVGSDVANLVLSDQRAATVARILTDFYDIPPENLVTQGYGERYLKVKTDGPEPLNRRVTVKRITPLVAYDK